MLLINHFSHVLVGYLIQPIKLGADIIGTYPFLLLPQIY